MGVVSDPRRAALDGAAEPLMGSVPRWLEFVLVLIALLILAVVMFAVLR